MKYGIKLILTAFLLLWGYAGVANTFTQAVDEQERILKLYQSGDISETEAERELFKIRKVIREAQQSQFPFKYGNRGMYTENKTTEASELREDMIMVRFFLDRYAPFWRVRVANATVFVLVVCIGGLLVLPYLLSKYGARSLEYTVNTRNAGYHEISPPELRSTYYPSPPQGRTLAEAMGTIPTQNQRTTIQSQGPLHSGEVPVHLL
jgi:hypothetical protein